MMFPESPDAVGTGRPLTVSALTKLIKGSLETSFPALSVEGEVSGTKLSSSGHLYFSLKDREALIQAVMFKFRRSSLDFELEDGQKVVARGGISVYAARGQYQLIVQSLRRAGLGDLLAMIEERKRRLAAEGLFDPERKRPLPRLPSRVGVVTSPTGAAFRDILQVLGRRNSGIDVLLFPAVVQGEDAPAAISARIAQASAFGNVDVLIVGRGGGAPEDLLAFSDEAVVRAIASSRVPVISAVGHEIDWTLSDLAADLRAPTPSAAAEMVAETRGALMAEVSQHADLLATSMQARLDYARASLDVFDPEDVEARFMRIFMPAARRFDDAREALVQGLRSALTDRGHRLDLAAAGLELASPEAVLRRGYAVVRRNEPGEVRSASPRESRLGTGKIVKDAADLSNGAALRIYFASGRAQVTVEEVDP